MSGENTFDVVVVGAGSFGAWTGWHLTKRGQKVLLVDAYGPANALASSGGESRIIRMGYGAEEIYTRWSQSSLTQWKTFFEERQRPLFHETGVLWLARQNDERLKQTEQTLKACGVRFEKLDHGGLEKRYPQVNFDGVSDGLLEPESGVLMARRAVAAVVADAVKHGAKYGAARVKTPGSTGRLEKVITEEGETIAARHFVFACGAWFPKVFPELLGERIFSSRQELFFFATPPGDARFCPPALPTWLFQEDAVYGMPDLEYRGLKAGFDNHGEKVDPDTQSRLPTREIMERVREYVGRRFPALREAPIVETRVCQYENTWNGDFLIDRHPEMENVWLVGGGSGHGFKHGPALGEYVAGQILWRAPAEARFLLANKEKVQKRAVF